MARLAFREGPELGLPVSVLLMFVMEGDNAQSAVELGRHLAVRDTPVAWGVPLAVCSTSE